MVSPTPLLLNTVARVRPSLRVAGAHRPLLPIPSPGTGPAAPWRQAPRLLSTQNNGPSPSGTQTQAEHRRRLPLYRTFLPLFSNQALAAVTCTSVRRVAAHYTGRADPGQTDVSVCQAGSLMRGGRRRRNGSHCRWQ
jgi:hypothetical protein